MIRDLGGCRGRCRVNSVIKDLVENLFYLALVSVCSRALIVHSLCHRATTAEPTSDVLGSGSDFRTESGNVQKLRPAPLSRRAPSSAGASAGGDRDAASAGGRPPRCG